MNFNLDEIDYDVLKILQEDARASISEISRRLGLSRPTVRRRIKRLLERGVIKKFTIVINEELEGGIKAIIGFKARNVKNILSELEKIDELSEIYITSGERNIICRGSFPDLKTFRELMNRFVELNIPFEANIILKTVRERWGGEFKLSFKLRCDYCGKEITDKPYKFIRYNREFNFCCPTCLREFRRMRES